MKTVAPSGRALAAARLVVNFRLEVLSDLGPGPLEPLARTVLTHL